MTILSHLSTPAVVLDLQERVQHGFHLLLKTANTIFKICLSSIHVNLILKFAKVALLAQYFPLVFFH